ncbi:hypothetical protein RJ55_00433 [Drechmeria coniospora]|nr:hypothetical protein RJ55_00433 [Drechmeria coniospora]
MSPTPPGLEIRPHPTKGRALYSTQSFVPGQTIRIFACPVLLLPSTAHLSAVCSYCLRLGEPRACSGCQAVWYCGKACQAAAWKSTLSTVGHARECSIFRKQRLAGRPSGNLPTPVRALLQMLLDDDVARVVDALEGHVVQRRGRNEEWKDLQLMAMAACAYAKGRAEEGELKRAVELLCKIQTNAFHRSDADLGQVGIFLEPTLAMANHSCLPNAMVEFSTRKAILRAERPIQAGEEIEISYTDYTYPLTKRVEALAQYCFQCACSRCTEDLNVYQVCAMTKSTTPAGLGLVPDASKLRAHPAARDQAQHALVKSMGESAAGPIEPPPATASLPLRRHLLRSQYGNCQGLVAGELWAVTPVPQMLSELVMYYVEDGNYPFALSVACLIATASDPSRFVSPFHPTRAKNLLMVAKLLSHTAEGTAGLGKSVKSVAGSVHLEQDVQDTLQDIDQVSLCQMLLVMVLRTALPGDADDGGLAARAREMLDDIEQLQGRQKELSFINPWIEDPGSEQSTAFFDYAVAQQVDALASLGRAVLHMDFGPDNR